MFRSPRRSATLPIRSRNSAGAGRAAVHRRQHLNLPRWDAELPGDAVGDQVDHLRGGGLRLVDGVWGSGDEVFAVGFGIAHRKLAMTDGALAGMTSESGRWER